MADPIDIYATIEDGKLIIERKDREPIAIIERNEIEENVVETVELGSTGNAVKAMQALLNCHGSNLDADGIFGPLSQQALISFQNEHNLPANGECEALTWQALIRS